MLRQVSDVTRAHAPCSPSHAPPAGLTARGLANIDGELSFLLNERAVDEEVVAWPELGDKPVPFGLTTGWVREGTNRAYAGLLKDSSDVASIKEVSPETTCCRISSIDRFDTYGTFL